jgi:hypothetical protein
MPTPLPPARGAVARFTAAIFALSMLALAAFAQVDRATASGTVKDATGAVVAGARVTVASPATGLRRETATGPNGFFAFPALPVGAYKLSVAQSGFAESSLELTLNAGETRSLDVTLQVTGVANTVDVVESDYLPVERESFTVGTVIRNEQVQNLPLNGRHWASLMALAPGAVNTGSGSQNSVRFNGRGRDENNFTLDGVDQTGVKDPRQEENLRLVISTEAVAEFRINTHIYSADQGAGAGAQVNLVSRSGTNDWHASAFHFLRNNKLDARAFNDVGEEDPFQLNQFGFRLGGPVKADRTFFFVSYEGLRQRRGVTFTNLVPSAAFRASVLASPNAGVLRPVLELYPLGTTPVNANTDSLVLQNKNVLDENSVNFRLDHRFSERRSLFFRTNLDVASATLYNREDSLNTRRFDFLPANHVLQFQEVFSPSFINETRFGVNRSPLERVDGNGKLVDGPRIDGFTRLRPTVTQFEKGTSYSLVNNSSWVRGRHTLRFGGEVRRIHVNVAESGVLELRFRSAADFLANRVDNFDLNSEQAMLGARRSFFMPYFQDDFRVSPNLTLNLGVRYDYYTVVKEAKGRGRVFDFACGGYCPAGTRWYAPDRNNVAPRVGFAYSPERFKNRTTVRGGFGIFYGPGQNDDVNAAIDNARDRFQLTRSQASNLSYPVAQFIGAGRPALPSPRALDRARRDFYSQNWTLSVLQELPLGLTGVVGYVGSSSHKLFSRSNLNVLNPVTKARPLPTFGEVDTKENRGNSSFHGLQTSLYRRLGKGFTLGAEYMWSHAISDFAGSGESEQPQDASNFRGERASTDFDVRHTFTTNYIWELPFGAGRRYLNDGAAGAVFGGWNFSGVVAARTGRPVNVTISRPAGDLPDGNSRSIQRPNLVAGVGVNGARDGSRGFINPAAFSVPAKGVYGSAPRNAARGASLVQFDTSLAKSFRLAERHKLDLRLDVFNLFNRPQYAQPDGFLGTVSSSGALTLNPTFGTSLTPLSVDIGTGTARSLQVSLRYSF